ncbi:MAG: hypothetical protein IPM29_13345 [Planctomycetes bacterium]|nr:hypothetical protein [Planctomycetota bacterium]
MTSHRAWPSSSPRSRSTSRVAGPALALVAALAACSSPPPAPPGAGLVSVDREPPAGARVAERPTPRVGDRLVYLRGGKVRTAFRYVEVDDENIVLEEEDVGSRLVMDRDLGLLREEPRGAPESARMRSPVDAQLSWPLWVGKRWVCEFVSSGPGIAVPLPIRALYTCDAIETLATPAGSFECYRVRRVTQPIGREDKSYDRHHILWYAPAVGHFACMLEDGLLTELLELHRQ